MHEYSIVQALINQCDDIVKENEATEVEKLTVKIGVLSGVEPDLLQTAFDTFKKGTVCENAEYIQYLQPVVIQCNDCQAESEIKNDEYNCPKCNSSSFDIIDGEDLILMQLVLN
jgi:hydrogenase nickel incorporation protein HypA/HybF